MPRRLPLIAFLFALALAATAAHAAPRVPQIPVSGTALATFFASQDQTIDVHNQQLDLQTMSLPSTASFEVRLFGPDRQTMTFGEYNSALGSPSLYQILPGGVTSGWYAVAGFRTGPTRVVVNLFDANNTFQGSNTYLAGPPDPNTVGFYAQELGGATFFTQDARNNSGAVKILAYNGTGSLTGWTWFACDNGPGSGGDFADFIALVNLSLAPTPTLRTDWGTLKARFR